MLIFKNGYIEWNAVKSKKLFDDEGNPIKGKPNTEQAECYIETLSENKQGTYDDGKFSQYSFSISINMNDDIIDNPPKNITIHHKYKGNLGVFVVQKIEYYDLTQTIVLSV